MSLRQPIDLSRLPLPDAVERLDFEAILADMKALILLLAPELSDALDLESEPVAKLLEVAAYRELVMRARANDSVRAVMLATATGADLDNLVALLGVQRQLIVPADPAAVPPVAAVHEDDAALRARAQMSWEALTNAGTPAAYAWHALSADARVRDVAVTRPEPGRVLVTILSHEPGGAPSAELLSAVAAVLDEAHRPRPLAGAQQRLCGECGGELCQQCRRRRHQAVQFGHRWGAEGAASGPVAGMDR